MLFLQRRACEEQERGAFAFHPQPSIRGYAAPTLPRLTGFVMISLLRPSP
jgi:hypothetical protein